MLPTDHREQTERWREGQARRRPRRSTATGYYLFAIAALALGALFAWPRVNQWLHRTPVVAGAPTPPAPLPRVPAPPPPVVAQREAPRPAPPQVRAAEPRPEPQGMVSAQYLANFRAERASRQAQARNLSRDVDQQWINGWDGRHRYLAQWVVVNNAIDGGSVCENQGRGSIDYRECRKGAKVFFRDQCRAWAARAAQEQQTWSYQMKDRYCHAESGFNPLG